MKQRAKSKEALEGVAGDWGVEGVSVFERVFGEDRRKFWRELVNGSGAGEGAGVSVVGEVVSDASEGLIEIVWIKGFALFVQV
jgi:hypothetical protein